MKNKPQIKVVRNAAMVMTVLTLVVGGKNVATAGIFGGGVLNHDTHKPYESFEVNNAAQFEEVIVKANGHDLGYLILFDERKQ
jgi:hypothetical protein